MRAYISLDPYKSNAMPMVRLFSLRNLSIKILLLQFSHIFVKQEKGFRELGCHLPTFQSLIMENLMPL